MIRYRKFRPADSASLARFVLDLYADEPGVMSRKKVQRTIGQLRRHPDLGTVIIFMVADQPAGYAIMLNFWSNEYSGNVAVIDELYVAPAYRRQGIASHFISWLWRTHWHDLVGLQLEVVPSNHQARKLYQRLGFRPHKNQVLTFGLPKHAVDK